jgi:phosphoribosylanthranilate isomerase
LTRPDEAAACAAAGADAVGCVFYPPSPRHVDRRRAAEIFAALPPAVVPVGVFVDPDFDTVMETVQIAGLRAVQLHGAESAGLVRRLQQQGLTVIKTLFADRSPGFATVADYPAAAFLVEWGRGPLPGGNAEPWDWGRARNLAGDTPLVLAGGLTTANVGRAVAACRPCAVDVSSGVEKRPGRKDTVRVAAFISAVARCGRPAAPDPSHLRRIF